MWFSIPSGFRSWGLLLMGGLGACGSSPSSSTPMPPATTPASTMMVDAATTPASNVMVDAAAKNADVAAPPAPVVMAGGPSHACGMSPAKEDGPQTIVVNGKMRNFIVRIPATTDTLHPHPLVYLWHGAGGSSAAFDSKNYGNIRKSWGDKAVLMMPDALIFDKTGATTWMRDAPDDLAFFDAMMAWIETRACFDKGHIFSTGHSSGAFWSHTLGCQRGNIIRGIAPISGGPREMNNCVGNVAAWIAHGEQDDNIAIKTGIAGRDFWRGRNDCPSTPAVATTPTPCVAYDGCKPGFPVQWCAFTGGHIWPAFATDAIWAFFSRL